MVDGVPAAIGARGGAFGLIEGDELVIVDPAGAAGQTLRPGLADATHDAGTDRDGGAGGQAGLGPAAARVRLSIRRRCSARAVRLRGARSARLQRRHARRRDGIPVRRARCRSRRRCGRWHGSPPISAARRSSAPSFYAQERSSREALDRILAVAPRFQQGATPERSSASVCTEARRTFGCDVAQVWTPVDDDQLEVSWRDPPSDVIPPGTRIAFADFPGLIEEMRSLRSMFVPNAQAAHPRRGAAARARLGMFSSLRIPIVIGAKFERILRCSGSESFRSPLHRWSRLRAGLPTRRASRSSRPSAVRAQEQTRALQAVTEALAAAATPADVGLAIVRQGVAALGARAATVYALTEDGEHVELLASEGYDPQDRRVEDDSDRRGDARSPTPIRTREVIVCGSYDEIAARYPWFDRTEESFVAAPLIAAGRAIGAVFIGSLAEGGHPAPILSVVVSLARQAAQALDRAQLFEREQASADTAPQAPGRDGGPFEGGHDGRRQPNVPGARDEQASAPRRGSSSSDGRDDRIEPLAVVAAIGLGTPADEIPAGRAVADRSPA